MPRRPGSIPTVHLGVHEMPTVHLAAEHPRPLCADHVRSGYWLRVRRGAFVERRGAPDDPFQRERWLALARVAAVLRQTAAADGVVSHTSAALLWGLPVLTVEPVTHLTRASRPGLRVADDVVRHVLRHGHDDVVELAGVRTTSLERTVVDCAATVGAHGGLVVADGALARGASRSRCEAIAEAVPGRRGIRTVRAVLAAADDGAESPGETRTRLTLLRAGLPRPVTQVAVATPQGTAWGDLGWPEHRLALEHDGREKYTAALSRTGAPADVVVREKRRQAAMEEAGWTVLRVTARDLDHPASLIRRIGRAAPPLVASVSPVARELLS